MYANFEKWLQEKIRIKEAYEFLFQDVFVFAELTNQGSAWTEHSTFMFFLDHAEHDLMIVGMDT